MEVFTINLDKQTKDELRESVIEKEENLDLTPREKELRYKPILPLFIKFSIPAIVGMLVQALYNVVDRYYIGNIPEIGPTAISGIGITLSVIFILMAFSLLFGVGAGANISIKLGEGKKEVAGRILGTALFMLIVSSFSLLILININMDGFLRAFGATDDNISYAKDYLRIILFGNLLNSCSFAFNNTIRAEGSPKYSMFAMLIGAITNVILDPIFIFTFGMGVKGAAYATVISQVLSFLWCMNFYLSKKTMLDMKLSYIRWDKELVKLITAIGVSPFFMQIAGSIVGLVINNSLKVYGGTVAQGAYAVINSINTIFFMPIIGMNQGLQPIIGYNYGAKKYNRVKKALITGIIAATLVSLIGWIMMQFFTSILVSPLAKSEELKNTAISGLRRYELLTIIVGFQIISSAFFQSINKAKTSFFLSLSRQIFILIPLVLILPLKMGLMGIWTATPIADVLATLISAYFILREIKTLNKQEEEMLVIK